MKDSRTPPYLKYLQFIVLMAVVLFNFSPISTSPVYAAPGNDAWQDATVIGSIPFSDAVTTTDAQQELDEPQLGPAAEDLCEGVPLRLGLTTVWYKYIAPAAPASALVSMDTLGSNQTLVIDPSTGLPYEYDTYIAVYTGTPSGNPTLVACNDDNDAGFRSQVGFTALANTTYYVQVAQYNGRLDTTYVAQPYQGGNLKFHVGYGAQTEVYIGGGLPKGTYDLLPGQSTRQSYVVDSGPVKVLSTNGTPIIASERILLKNSPTYSSYSEFMGLPFSKLSDTYLFPWYNNVGLELQLRFGNVGNATTTVTITIGGVPQVPTYTLAPNASARAMFTNVDNGPVQVKSSGGVPIIASMRVNLKHHPTYSSYTEFLGLSGSSTVGTQYIFPWYNNVGLESQLRFGNVGNASTTVTITIGGVPQAQTYVLAPSASARVMFPNVDNGPVKVESSGGVPIIASMRVNLRKHPSYTSYSEFIGLSGSTLTDTKYLFPWYNNVGLESQLRFGNVGSVSTTVTITIGGVPQVPTYILAPNESAKVMIPNVDNGPVVVSSSGGVPIIASMRINLKKHPVYSSYAEFMGLSMGTPVGLPGNQVSDTYWLPWYNNTGGLDSQLRFGVP